MDVTAAGSDLDSTLGRLTQEAEAQWPGFRLAQDDFRAVLLDAIRIGDGSAEERLEKLHAGDLYLATACARGQPVAVKEFITRYLTRVERHVRRLGTTEIRADDVRRELEDALLFGRDGKGGRIAQYTGRGPLERFVAVVARNAALTLLRIAARQGQASPLGSDVESPADSSGLLRSQYAPAIRISVRGALAALERRPRMILRLHLVQGLNFTQIGRMLRVHQSTVSRTFDAALRELHRGIRKQMHELLRVGDDEMASIVADVWSRLDVSLSQILRDTHEEHGDED